MTSSTPPSSASVGHLPIAAVERETGLGKDTLRVWERRYGFPTPIRDEHGNRAYPSEQVQRLRAIKRLLDQGMRPGKVFTLSDAELEAQINPSAAPECVPQTIPASLALHWDYLTGHRNNELRQIMTRDLARLGVAGFLERVVVPMNDLIGQAWSSGEIQVFEEHLYTEVITRVLRQGIGVVQEQHTQGRPIVLLTTLPGESHGLGLLMAEAMLALHGAQCIALGTQTPLLDIAAAASAHQADIVALSFSAYPSPKQVAQGVQGLLALLPEPTALWVGGSSAKLRDLGVARLHVFGDLASIQDALDAWRLKHLN